MSDEVRQVELRRLRKLELQAAKFGPHTDPGILIEIQDLYHKYPEYNQFDISNRHVSSVALDYDFLMNTVAAALKRLTEVEIAIQMDRENRNKRQLKLDMWMAALSVISFLTLVLTLGAR